MTAWFGKSWGAPCCEPELHTETPVGKSCAYCHELILVGHQGFISPYVTWTDRELSTLVHHVDCYTRQFIPHTIECPHCRGRDRQNDHDAGCNYVTREGDGNCSCFGAWAIPVGVRELAP